MARCPGCQRRTRARAVDGARVVSLCASCEVEAEEAKKLAATCPHPGVRNGCCTACGSLKCDDGNLGDADAASAYTEGGMSEWWVCSAGDKRLAVRCASVLTAWEVRQFAAKRLGVDPPALDSRLSDDGVPSGVPAVELQWVGNDFSHGGTPGGRRLQERVLGTSEWADV